VVHQRRLSPWPVGGDAPRLAGAVVIASRAYPRAELARCCERRRARVREVGLCSDPTRPPSTWRPSRTGLAIPRELAVRTSDARQRSPRGTDVRLDPGPRGGSAAIPRGTGFRFDVRTR